jgi:hypothetical protein
MHMGCSVQGLMWVQPLMKTPLLLLMPRMMMLAIRVLSWRVAAVWTTKTRSSSSSSSSSRDIQRVMVVQVQGPTAHTCQVCWPAAVLQVVMLPVVLRQMESRSLRQWQGREAPQPPAT